MIQFDEQTHTYTHGGVRVPSVTQILKPLYGDLRFVKQDLLDYKSELGVAVHKAVELHVLGRLDYKSLVSPVSEYFAGYMKFERDTGFIGTATEVKVFSPLGYAGTLDLAGELESGSALIDLKCTAQLSPVVALQTAAYQQAYDNKRKRYALRLMPNDYRLQPYERASDASDFAAFLGLLRVRQWCAANRIDMGEVANV